MTDPNRPLQYSLLAPLPDASAGEVVQTLAAGPGFRLVRIVSHGQVSDEDFWYDQTEAEWVMVVSGCGHVAIEGESTDRVLGPGAVLILPARCRHRVTMTSVDAPTIWLALFMELEGAAAADPLPGKGPLHETTA